MKQRWRRSPFCLRVKTLCLSVKLLCCYIVWFYKYVITFLIFFLKVRELSSKYNYIFGCLCISCSFRTKSSSVIVLFMAEILLNKLFGYTALFAAVIRQNSNHTSIICYHILISFMVGIGCSVFHERGFGSSRLAHADGW